MSHNRIILCALFFFILAAVGQERRLPCKADALAGDVLKSGVWDFSRQWKSDNGTGASVRVYGDSLLAETVEGRRYWYSLSHDSIFYCGVRYYIADWQGNNAAVVSADGSLVQKTDYYPYGEPTVESSGQRYLFSGKEREHAAGRNSYDFGARSLTPYGQWISPDKKAETFYSLSPYSYCGGDPINKIDKDGEFPVLLAAAFIGAAIDMGTQMATFLVGGYSVTESFNKIDWTSVAASAGTSVLLGPEASTLHKSAAFCINVADAVIDVKGEGFVYIGGNDNNSKPCAEVVIDFAAGIFPDFLIKHTPMNTSTSGMSSIIKVETKDWTKEEMDTATKIVFTINGIGLKISLIDENPLKQQKRSELTDAIQPKPVPPICMKK